MNVDLNPIVGAAGMLVAGCITAATPGLMAWIKAKTHSETLTTAAKVGGDTAYAALVAATQAATAKGGTVDYVAAERAAVAAGILAVQSVAVPAVANLTEAAVKTAVVQGLGSKLAKDPTVSAIGAAVATATGPAASASAGQGAPAAQSDQSLMPPYSL